MKALYLDPLIPRGEHAEATLRRLSSNIGTLTGLIGDAERTGHWYLAGMFSRSRDTKVAEALAPIALLKEENANGVEEAVSPFLPTEGGPRPDADNKGRTHGKRPKVAGELLPAGALLLMDTATVRPERWFLLVGIALTGIGTAPLTFRRSRQDETRFALAEGISPFSLVHPLLPDRQAA